MIFNRILDGTATKEERASYILAIKTSCLNEEFLIYQIQKKAEEMKN